MSAGQLMKWTVMRRIQEAMQQFLASTLLAGQAAHDHNMLGRNLVDLVGGNPGRASTNIRSKEGT